MTTPSAIIADAISALSFQKPFRTDQEYFQPHLGNQPFEHTPKSKRDGYEIVEREYQLTSGFGVLGQKESQFLMVVRLGHAPFGTDQTRETNRVTDIERIVDVFESRAWPAGTFTVLFEKEQVEKKNANWWLTEIFFKVVLTGAIVT